MRGCSASPGSKRLTLSELFFADVCLDVSKAHRRILIRPSDQGLHRDALYECITLNFGAQALGYYWSRLAGILGHRIIYMGQSLLVYVSDLICLLSANTSTVLAALLVLLLCILRAHELAQGFLARHSRLAWLDHGGWEKRRTSSSSLNLFVAL